MEGAGSAIIILRHLRRLKAHGWRISIVGDWGQDERYCRAEGWPVFSLPLRRALWPPYKESIRLLRKIRYRLWSREVETWIGKSRPNAVLTYLSAFSDTLSQAGAAYAHRNRLPLTCLIHDDCNAFPTPNKHRRDRYREILRKSSQNWFVSAELAQAYGFFGTADEVLPPISETQLASNPPSPSPGKPRSWIYAGNVRDPQVATLASIATVLDRNKTQLIVLAEKTPKLEEALKRTPIKWRPPFTANQEALEWLRSNAAVLLAAYAADSNDQPWIRSSFPSKVIEYLHLGIPVVVAAPNDSAIHNWALKCHWPDIFHPEDTQSIQDYCTQIQNPTHWRNKAELAQSFARRYFDPDEIQERFESRLIPST